jgi:hypothetical protein
MYNLKILPPLVEQQYHQNHEITSLASLNFTYYASQPGSNLEVINRCLYFLCSMWLVLEADLVVVKRYIIIIIILSGVRLSLLVLRPLLAYCTSPR